VVERDRPGRGFPEWTAAVRQTAVVRSVIFIGDLNRFFAIANLTLTQHLLEKKIKKEHVYTLDPGQQNMNTIPGMWKRKVNFYKSGEEKENLKHKCFCLYY